MAPPLFIVLIHNIVLCVYIHTTVSDLILQLPKTKNPPPISIPRTVSSYSRVERLANTLSRRYPTPIKRWLSKRLPRSTQLELEGHRGAIRP